MMNKTKVDFISDLLAHKNISVAEKELIFELSKNEIQKLGEFDELKFKEIIDRIERLEKEKVADEKEAKSISNEKPKSKNYENTGNPKDVAKFMALFNEREGLKYLTHDYDEDGNFEIDEFLTSREKIFSEKTSKNLKIPQSLWAIVKKFAFDSKQTKWCSISEDYKENQTIEIGWASKELRDWSKQNKLHPIKNDKYKKIINDFRRITRIESPNLEKLVNNTIDKVFSDEKKEYGFEKEKLSKADFYTHVSSFKTALEIVFEEMKKRATDENKKKIKIEYQRDTDKKLFVRKILVTQYNSFPTKELDVLLKEWCGLEKGSMGNIAKKIQGYCYWSVVTQIEGTPIKVNILKEETTKKYESVASSKAVGFTHIFTFYY